MRKLLFMLTALLLLALPALGEGVPGMLDWTDRGEIRDRDVPALAEELLAIEGVTACDLRGVKISLDAQVKLADMCPDIDFHWYMDINKSQVYNHTAHLDLDALPNKVGYQKLMKILRCFTGLEEVTMFNYRYSVKDNAFSLL